MMRRVAMGLFLASGITLCGCGGRSGPRPADAGLVDGPVVSTDGPRDVGPDGGDGPNRRCSAYVEPDGGFCEFMGPDCPDGQIAWGMVGDVCSQELTSCVPLPAECLGIADVIRCATEKLCESCVCRAGWEDHCGYSCGAVMCCNAYPPPDM